MEIEMRGINKSFGNNAVLNNAGFVLSTGEIHALMGENGAGKSTLMKILTGVYTKDVGQVIVDGQEVCYKNAREAEKAGIVFIHQELNVLFDLTVEENMFLGKEIKKKCGVCDKKAMRREVEKILKRLGVEIDPGQRMEELSVGQQQMVEIAKACSLNMKLLIMDEPTSSLSESEVDSLFEMIRKLKNRGIGIIYISHKLEEVFTITDRVCVMRDGGYVGTIITKESDRDTLVSMMVGRALDNYYTRTFNEPGEVVFEVKNINSGIRVKNCSFKVRKGEIVGFYGLVGAGRTELFSCIYGLTKSHSGSLYLNGKEVVMKSPVDAIANGIGLVPEERRKQGMFALLSIYENVMMPSYHTISSKGVINFDEAKKRTNRQIDAMRIKTPSCNTQIKNLSGGNQQKVILGRWMEKNVDILILDEPTRGIDVRAKGEIYRLIREMADNGVTVIVISSEMDELISVSDRIMVMHEGLVKGFMEPSEDMVGEEILKVALK